MLRISIEGRWSPDEFIALLEGFEGLYYKSHKWSTSSYGIPHPSLSEILLSRSMTRGHVNYILTEEGRTLADRQSRLEVAAISYGSPGSIDLVGLGKAFEAIASIIEKLIKYFSERKLREVQLERERESLRSLKLENARQLLELRRDYPDVPDSLLISLCILDQDKLIPLIAERKILDVRQLPGD